MFYCFSLDFLDGVTCATFLASIAVVAEVEIEKSGIHVW